MRKSIFLRYFTIVAVIAFVSVVLFSGIVVFNSQKQWIEDKNELLSKNVETIARMSAEISVKQSCDTIDVIGEIIDATIFVVDESGNCIYISGNEYDSPEYNQPIDGRILKKALRGKYSEKGTLNGALKSNCFVVSFPIEYKGVAQGVVFATVPMRAVNSYTVSTLKTVVICAVMVLVFAFCATYVVSVQMSRPLRNMVQVVKKIESGDFSAKVPVGRHDEIGQLAEALNKMTVSIGALENMRRSFISSVSHELKTPMQTISGFVDGILDGTIPENEREKYLRIVSEETKRLSRLVNSMLQLSRLESEKMKLNKTTFNISDMIISVFLSFEKRVEEKNISIVGLDLLNPLSLTADRDLIYQVIYNLTENAIKFTPDGGEISVKCQADKQSINFSIRNSGEGLTQKEMAQIFDRFYKTDRSRSVDKGGMGFGLYIVKTIVSLHGGYISVGSILSEYTEFEVKLPNREIVAEIDNRENQL